jgi:type II secretory pathway component GspD/PulD (secretin)
MKSKRALLILIALLLAGLSAFAAPEPAGDAKAVTVRSFTFKYKEADKAAAVIKPLMSADGSISLQPANNALVVTDHAENLKAIAKALGDYDAPAQSFKLSIRLVSASRVEGAGPRVRKELEDVAAKMAMFRYNSFESAGEANVEGKEGDAEVVDVPGYHADFKLGAYDPASQSIQVSDLKLSRLQNDQLTQLLKTTLNLRIGQMYVLGAAKDPKSQRALLIVITARR